MKWEQRTSGCLSYAKEVCGMVRDKKIGARIREIRKLKGMTLATLAQKTNLTKGYLSLLENDKKVPPVATLLTIAQALDTRISDIFDETAENASISIVRKDERLAMARPGTLFGYHYESLAYKYQNKSMDVYILTRPVDPQWKPVMFKHEGEEMLYILEGAIEFYYGQESYTVRAGDCIYFESSVEHYGKSLGDKPAKMLMVATLPAHTRQKAE